MVDKKQSTLLTNVSTLLSDAKSWECHYSNDQDWTLRYAKAHCFLVMAVGTEGIVR